MSKKQFTSPYQGAMNQILIGDKFFVSYNPGAGADPTSVLLGAFAGIKGREGTMSSETALVDDRGKTKVFKILSGDWRKEYLERIDSWEDCLAFFDSKKAEFGSDWSTEEEDRGDANK